MTISLFNTDGRQVQTLTPVDVGEVKMYCCGPTVYNYAHIGNLRTYIFEDVLRRIIIKDGLKIKHTMNITDVGHLTSDQDTGEDKMVKAAIKEQKGVLELARFYEEAFFKDCADLNIQRPDIVCRATETIDDIIEFIKVLLDKGFAYIAGGNVYLDSMKYEKYGQMAGLDLENLRHGARVDTDSNKKNPTDSVLWFTQSKFSNHILSWKSPWGDFGYPGWNIECSVMAYKHLGPRLDIHCGGIDHVPVHHTNEIAQSELFLGHKWCNHWVHGEFLQLGEEKMSKSKGEFLTVSVLKDRGYNPLAYRYLCLTAHYRSPLKFTFDILDSAQSAYNNLKNRVIELKDNINNVGQSTENKDKFLNEFFKYTNDDMNMPQALAVMWNVVKTDVLSSKDKLDILLEMDEILGLGIAEMKKDEISVTPEIQKIIDDRKQARLEKNWALSDELRDQLLNEYGLLIKDGPNGAVELIKK